MPYVLLKDGRVLVICNDIENGYLARPLKTTFQDCIDRNLFVEVKHDDVVVVDTNLSVIDYHLAKIEA